MKTGRPTLYKEPMPTHNVVLPRAMARAITEYGEGNFSRGVRKLWNAHVQQLKAEHTKDWMRDWRSNPTASSDPPHEVVNEPGQEMLPPPSDPTSIEDATVLIDVREDSGAIEAVAQSGYWFKSQGTGDEL